MSQPNNSPPTTPQKKRIINGSTFSLPPSPEASSSISRKHEVNKLLSIKKNSKTPSIYPTPEVTPHLNSIKKLSNVAVVPKFSGKRSFDVTSSMNDLEEDLEDSRDSKRMKLSTENVLTEFYKDDFEDLDSDVSTELASDVEGDFYKSAVRSEDEHRQFNTNHAINSCLTPERPQQNTKNINLLKSFIDSDDELDNFDNKDKLFETPESKIITSKDFGSQGISSDLSFNKQRTKQSNFNPNDELLLINNNGKVKNLQFNNATDKFFKPKKLLSEFHEVADNNNQEEEKKEVEFDDPKEARLIREAMEQDEKSTSFHFDGNYSGDEGFSDYEDFDKEDEDFNNEEKLSNYFDRMRTRRFQKKLTGAKRGKIEFLNASGIESDYNESDEQEEEYLKKLMSKKTLPSSTSSRTLAGATKKKLFPDSPTPTSTNTKTNNKNNKTPSSRPSSSSSTNSQKTTFLKNKRLMLAEDHDNYLNFGFTISELADLKKAKKILVFEDPKNSSNKKNSS